MSHPYGLEYHEPKLPDAHECENCIRIENEDTGLCADEFIWQGYSLETWGCTEDQMIENAVLWKTDQDGGECGEDMLTDHGGEVYDVGVKIIRAALEKARWKACPQATGGACL